MRLLVTGGGTGGHVYPALTVLDAIRCLQKGDLTACYLGTAAGMEGNIVRQHQVPFQVIPAGKVRVGNPFAAAAGIGISLWGLVAALRFIRSFRPDAILATGGYVSIPAIVAGRLSGIGSVVYLPDTTPGWAVRAMSRIASVVATTTEKARPWLPGANVVVTGYPLRAGFEPVSKEIARTALGLDQDLHTITVTGGSLGAQRINNAIALHAERLLEHCQVLHITGKIDYERICEERLKLPEALQQRWIIRDYLSDEIPLAFSAADLIISRSGASALGEYPAVGRASLLVPGPFSGQIANATYMVEVGASMLLSNDRANDIADVALSLLADPARIAAMEDATRRLNRPNAAQTIGKLVETVAGSRK